VPASGARRETCASMSGRGPNPDFLLGGRTSASAECSHWSGRAVRWSSCAILLRIIDHLQSLRRLAGPQVAGPVSLLGALVALIARAALEALRWPDGPVCPNADCGADGRKLLLQDSPAPDRPLRAPEESVDSFELRPAVRVAGDLGALRESPESIKRHRPPGPFGVWSP
jgi:hypothetical protein